MANAAPQGGESGASSKSKPSLKALIAQILVVAALSGATGAGYDTLGLRPRPPGEKSAAANAAAAPQAPASILDLAPIVTNLGTPQDVWIRLEGSIVFDAKTMPHPEVIGGEIAADALAYLRTLSLHDVEGSVGLQNLRQDLNERATLRSGGKVKEFLIRTLVVQ